MPSPIPLVSVIIPVYNHENYLVQALRSVFDQTYPHLEIIIIDDGSKDKSCERIEQLLEEFKKQTEKQSRSIIFIKQANQGAHTTINYGLSLAKGEFLTILNSDDYFRTDRIEIFVREIEKQRADWAFSKIEPIDAKSDPLPFLHDWTLWYNEANRLLENAPTVGFGLMNCNIAVSTGNLFFRKNFYDLVGEFKNLRITHDLDFILRALIISEPLYIPEKLYFYRLHGHNTVNSSKGIGEEEQEGCYRDYLLSLLSKPPTNHKAPSHWYWPSTFFQYFPRAKNNELFYSKFISDSPRIASEHKDQTLTNKKPFFQYFPRAKNNELFYSKFISDSPRIASEHKDQTLTNKKPFFQYFPRAKNNELLYSKFISDSPKVVSEHKDQTLPNKKPFTKTPITLITPSLDISDSVRSFFNLALQLQERGHKVNVISQQPGHFEKAFKEHQIDVFALPKGLNFTEKGISKLVRYTRFICTFPIVWFKSKKIVIVDSVECSFALLPLTLISPFKKFFWMIKESYLPSAWLASRSFQTLLDRSIKNPRFHFWFQSPDSQKAWELMNIRGELRPWNGVSTQPNMRKEKNAILNIIAVGSFEPSKGTNHLIEAFSKCVSEERIPKEVTLTIVGFEPLKKRVGFMLDLIQKGIQEDLKDRIKFIPALMNLDSLFQDSDLFIDSSTHDYVSPSIIKAMSFGLPIIAPNTETVHEVLQHEQTGYLCNPRNEYSLADAIDTLISRPKESFEMGLRAQDIFKKQFSVEKIGTLLFDDLEK
jgi:glycosyltransferase involved in cell wall biosynthesis